ncbi:hypothetical protein NE237_004931 [Protea cynaroides]|uniref:Uncharacterized protein n=1 Tax=Protea cynaroides TaxID=273540 RepID=A0A9Q0QU37_9MAGN|nr:hypothetical protein NE237_004931 [Protea cynaroides]
MVREGDSHQMRNHRKWFAKEKGKRALPVGGSRSRLQVMTLAAWEINMILVYFLIRLRGYVLGRWADVIDEGADPTVEEGEIAQEQASDFLNVEVQHTMIEKPNLPTVQEHVVIVLELPLRSGDTISTRPGSSKVAKSFSQGVSLLDRSPNTANFDSSQRVVNPGMVEIIFFDVMATDEELQQGVGVFTTVEKQPLDRPPGSGKSRETFASRMASRLTHMETLRNEVDDEDPLLEYMGSLPLV